MELRQETTLVALDTTLIFMTRNSQCRNICFIRNLAVDEENDWGLCSVSLIDLTLLVGWPINNLCHSSPKVLFVNYRVGRKLRVYWATLGSHEKWLHVAILSMKFSWLLSLHVIPQSFQVSGHPATCRYSVFHRT